MFQERLVPSEIIGKVYQMFGYFVAESIFLWGKWSVAIMTWHDTVVAQNTQSFSNIVPSSRVNKQIAKMGRGSELNTKTSDFQNIIFHGNNLHEFHVPFQRCQKRWHFLQRKCLSEIRIYKCMTNFMVALWAILNKIKSWEWIIHFSI